MVRRISVSVSREAGALLLGYAIQGDIERLKVPSPRQPDFADGLWRHTCCEAFVKRPGDAPYHELNFSPSGAWASYRFDAYREGQQPVTGVQPRIAVRRASGVLELEAALPLAALSCGYEHAPLALALSAVIEDERGAISYWALAHAPGKPDFHAFTALTTVEVP